MVHTASALQQETYEAADSGALAEVHDFLEAHKVSRREDIEPRYFLAGAGVGDQVELPAEVHQILLQVVEAMQRGLAVTVSPQSRTLTTQQTAELLGVSRPTVVKLLDNGEIPFEKVGTHRRLRLTDVLEYRKARRTEQYDALANLYADADETEHNIDQTLTELREARRAIADARRSALRTDQNS